MNIKSLLIGSAAAIVAVSGARAADAVVIAEPEPFEYVRVCDTYGAGFFYIPGTETCLRVSGLLRYDIDYIGDNEYRLTRDDFRHAFDYFSDAFDDDEVAAQYELDELLGLADDRVGPWVFQDGLDEGWAKRAYARVNFDARSETEWGTFRRYIRMETGTEGRAEGIYGLGGNDAWEVNVIHAYVELGGLLVGMYDTLYDADLDWELDSGGGSRAHQIRYTFEGGNGFTFAVSLEEQDYNWDYTPNIVGSVALTQGWGSVALFAAYDATFEDFGVKAMGSFDVTDAITLEALATYESGFGDFSVATANGLIGYEWSLAGAVAFKATDTIKINAGGQMFWNQHWLGHDNYRVGANVDWTPVQNMLLRGQVSYNGGDSQDFVDARFRLETAF